MKNTMHCVTLGLKNLSVLISKWA